MRTALKGKPPKGTKRWTQRSLAKAIGCSPTLTGGLPAWIAYYAEHSKTKAKAPRAVGLTDAVLNNEGREDAELQRLIGEHEADFEPSPLISDARKQRRRPKV